MGTSQSLSEHDAQADTRVAKPWDTAVAQIVAYVLLVLFSVVSPARDAGSTVYVPFTVIGVVAVLVAFLICSPLRDGIPGRVIAGVCGVASLLFAIVPSAGGVMFSQSSNSQIATDEGASAAYYPQEVWAAGVCGLLVVLIIVSFVRQMAREDRSHLIRSLSHGVMGGVAAIAVSGWCFFPDLIEACRIADSTAAICAAWVSGVVIVALVVLLAICAHLWGRDANPPERAVRPWCGIGFLPPMFLGPVIAVASLVVEAL